MKLFEITTGECGEAFVRAYVWAVDEATARTEFTRTHFPKRIEVVEELLDSTDPPFVTGLSDSGFAERAVRS